MTKTKCVNTWKMRTIMNKYKRITLTCLFMFEEWKVEA